MSKPEKTSKAYMAKGNTWKQPKMPISGKQERKNPMTITESQATRQVKHLRQLKPERNNPVRVVQAIRG